MLSAAGHSECDYHDINRKLDLLPQREHDIVYRMRVITKRVLREFWEKHADVRPQLQAWLENAERSEWNEPRDIQKIYGDDAVLPGNRAVFNIRGNRYRLVAKIHYNTGIVYIRFIGTHAEYDRIDVHQI